MNKFKSIFILIAIILLASVLRIWQLDRVPVSLFGDELDVGYHAYSILKTGRDYTGHFMPLQFKSLSEYRTPLYLYSSIPTVAIFGITPWGVRLPAALFGILTVPFLYLLVKKVSNNQAMALLAAFILAITPWHIHFSRAGFEVTEMIFLFVLGIYAFLVGLKKTNSLSLSAVSLALTPLTYNTAKLFLPCILIAILIIWRKDLWGLARKKLILPALIMLLILVPYGYSTVFGGGVDRFASIAISDDATIVPQVGFARLRDLQMSDPNIQNASNPGLVSKLFHNPTEFLWNEFLTNYLQSFSTDFLFSNGDPSPRHSLPNNGLFYRFEIILLIVGAYALIRKPTDRKFSYFMITWLLLAPVPSALTQNGGTHATRLILMIIPLVYLIALGGYSIYGYLSQKLRKAYLVTFLICSILSLSIYLHNYWVHYPWDSERWWQSGFQDAIQSTVSQSKNYQQVIISNADEPTLIFFLAWSMYPPAEFQQNYPLQQVNLGKLVQNGTHLGKYYFTSQGQSQSIYNLAALLPDNTLYLATQKEVNVDLVHEPERLPKDLTLIKAITNPSGTPAFYLLTKRVQ